MKDIKKDRILPVVTLTFRRPQYLQKTIQTFIEKNENNLDMFSFRILVQGGLDPGTANVLKKWKDYLDFVDVRDKNEGCARGFNICMQEALRLRTPYLLHLQDDWESKEPISNYLPEIFNFMDTHKVVGCIRLGSIHEKGSKRNVISGDLVRWSKKSKHILVGNAHFTLQPTILRCDVVEQMTPIIKEHHAQQKYHKLGLQVAQLDADCFLHTGRRRGKKYLSGWKR